MAVGGVFFLTPRPSKSPEPIRFKVLPKKLNVPHAEVTRGRSGSGRWSVASERRFQLVSVLVKNVPKTDSDRGLTCQDPRAQGGFMMKVRRDKRGG